MARSFTVAQLISRGTKRADAEGDDHISSTEWKENLSTVYAELYSIIVDSGARYYETEATIAADGSASYALPAAHLSTIAIDGEVGNRRYALREAMMQERNRHTGNTGRAQEFSLVGANIELYPIPSSGSYYHTYIPQPTDLSAANDGDSIDVVTPDGEAFITWSLSVLAKAKNEEDPRLDIAEREAARARVREWAMNRSFMNPRRTMLGDEDGGFYGRRDPDGWW